MGSISFPCQLSDAWRLGETAGSGIVDAVVPGSYSLGYGDSCVAETDIFPGSCTIHGAAYVLETMDSLH